MRRFLGLSSIAILSLSSPAAASSHCESLLGGEFGCACAMSLQDSDATAILSNIVGNVDITTSNPYSPADPAVPLNVGDSVMVLEDSSAFLTFGPTCSRQLPEQSSLVIREVEGCACAALVQAQTEASEIPGGVFLLGAGLAGTGLAIYLLTQGDDDDEPVTPD